MMIQTTLKQGCRSACAFITAVGISVAAAACTTPEGGQSQDSSSLAISLPFKPVASLSPFSDDAVLNTRMGIAETLVTLDADGKPQPKLAESWTTPDPNKVVFTLRDGIKFHDGTPVNAESIVTSLHHAWDAPSRPKGLGKKALTFEATGDHEVTVTSEVADPILPQRFADPGTVILSQDAYTGDTPTVKGHGTGPFQLSEVDSTSATATKYADYWDGAPKLERLTVRFIEDGNARANAIRAGEVSMAQAVPIAQLGELRDLTIDSTPLPRGVYLHLNTSKGEFADPAIRAAAAQAVRPDAIVDSIYEGHAGKTHGSLFNEKTEWASHVDSHNNTDNAADAHGKAITLATWKERPELGEVASVVADQLREAGFEVNVVVRDYKSMEPALLGGEYDAVIGSRNYQSGAADPVSFLASDYTCEGSYNLSRYCNPEIDEAIAKADGTTDNEERYTQAAEVGAKIVGDNAVIPLAHEYSINAYDTVSNLNFDPFERLLVTKDTAHS